MEDDTPENPTIKLEKGEGTTFRDVDTDIENSWGRYLEVSDSWQ